MPAECTSWKTDRRKEAEEALAFVDATWDVLTSNARHGRSDSFSSWAELAKTSVDGHLDDTDPANPYILYLPNDFVTPGGRFMVQFYWDSYFIVLSLLRAQRFELARGMVDNCLFLIERHGMVIANRKRWAAGSQLPFLSQMVREVYLATGDLGWLRIAAPLVQREYAGYWLNSDHLVSEGMSRYHAPPCYPADSLPRITMDHEATWDLSPRFEEHDVLSLLPVDLNSNLYAYEIDLSFFSRELGLKSDEREWLSRAEYRKRQINARLWDDIDGLYYDLNVESGQLKRVKSLASFFPLLYGIADPKQQDQVADNLCLFEQPFGLVTCDQAYGYSDRQWNFPVGWPPLHLLVCRALAQVGKLDSAKRIASKWLSLNLDTWLRTGKFYEKYDVVSGSHEVLLDRYRNQEGFGWTNAVFQLLAEDFEDWR